MAIDILSIQAITAGIERLFSQCKIMLSDRRNRLHIDCLEAVEWMKSWDKLRLRLLQVGVISPILVAEDGEGAQSEGYRVKVKLRWILRMKTMQLDNM
jgi:hypothetical protein